MNLGSAGAEDGGTLKRGGSWGWGGERRPGRGPEGGEARAEPSCRAPLGPRVRVRLSVSLRPCPVQSRLIPGGTSTPPPLLLAPSPQCFGQSFQDLQS